MAEEMLKILPIAGSLKQGRKRSIEQFGYRYNSDEKSIIFALAGFHSNFHVLTPHDVGLWILWPSCRTLTRDQHTQTLSRN